MAAYLSDSDSDLGYSSSDSSSYDGYSSSDDEHHALVLVDRTPAASRHAPVVVQKHVRRVPLRRTIVSANSNPTIMHKKHTTTEVAHIHPHGEDVVRTSESHNMQTTQTSRGQLKRHKHTKQAKRHQIRHDPITSTVHHRDTAVQTELLDEVFYPGAAKAEARKNGGAPDRKKRVTARMRHYDTVNDKSGDRLILFTDPYSEAVLSREKLTPEEREYLDSLNASMYDRATIRTDSIVQPVRRVLKRGVDDFMFVADKTIDTGKEASDILLSGLGAGNIQRVVDDTYELIRDTTVGNVSRLFNPVQPLEPMEFDTYGNARLAKANGAARFFDKTPTKSGSNAAKIEERMRNLRLEMLESKE